MFFVKDATKIKSVIMLLSVITVTKLPSECGCLFQKFGGMGVGTAGVTVGVVLRWGLCSLRWPGTQYVGLAGLKCRDLSVCASLVSRLKV